MQKKFGRVHELLINSEKASTSPAFEENVERFLCLRFSITHTNYLLFFSSITVLHQLDQKIIYPHYDFKHLTEKYFEIGMKLDDFLIQLVEY